MYKLLSFLKLLLEYEQTLLQTNPIRKCVDILNMLNTATENEKNTTFIYYFIRTQLNLYLLIAMFTICNVIKQFTGKTDNNFASYLFNQNLDCSNSI